jgi:hypothetical protein
VLVRNAALFRVANMLPGLSLVAIGYLIAEQVASPVRHVVFAIFALLGLLYSVRGYRMAVFIDNDSVLVRGFSYSRRIPRSAIFEMTVLGAPWWAFPLVRLPMLHWRGAGGRKRRTPILAFSEGLSVSAKLSNDNEERLAIIQHAIFKRHPRGKHH